MRNVATMSPEELALRVRELCGRGYPYNPATAAESEGIRVLQADFHADTAKLINGAISKAGNAIYVNTLDSIKEKRYALVHELGHYFLHFPKAEAFICNRDLFIRDGKGTIKEKWKVELESEANRFAMTLLMPYEDVVSQWLFVDSLAELGDKFGVPEYIAKRRIDEMRKMGFTV